MRHGAGYGSNKNGFHLQALAAALASKGIASLRFDFSGERDVTMFWLRPDQFKCLYLGH